MCHSMLYYTHLYRETCTALSGYINIYSDPMPASYILHQWQMVVSFCNNIDYWLVFITNKCESKLTAINHVRIITTCVWCRISHFNVKYSISVRMWVILCCLLLPLIARTRARTHTHIYIHTERQRDTHRESERSYYISRRACLDIPAMWHMCGAD